MIESNLMHGWFALLNTLALLTLIFSALGLMVGRVKPADAVKKVGGILGIVIVLILMPGFVLNAWSSMSLWQHIAFVAIGIGGFMWLRPRRRRERGKVE